MNNILDLLKNINISYFIEYIIKYSLVGADKFWSIAIWLIKMSLYLALIIIFIISLLTIIYFIIKKFNKELAQSMRIGIIKILEDNFYESEIYEAMKSLFASIADAIVTILETLTLSITLFFQGFSIIIQYPFNMIQIFLNRINYKMQEMRDEQNEKFSKRKAKERKRISFNGSRKNDETEKDHSEKKDEEKCGEENIRDQSRLEDTDISGNPHHSEKENEEEHGKRTSVINQSKLEDIDISDNLFDFSIRDNK